MSSKRKLALVVIVAVSLLVGTPVMVEKLSSKPARSLTGVSLDQVDVQQVRFRNEHADLDLAGMLFLPEGEGPYPGAIIIHGSGTSTRANAWYLTVAESLRRSGIAVLLPDKRGSEQSAGNWRTTSFPDLATDSVAAVDFLKQSDSKISHVGIIGMSQGGHIAALVANQSDDVRFVVNVVGSTVPLRRSLVYEETHNLRQSGFLPGVSDCLARVSSFYLRRIGQREFWSAIDGYDPIDDWRQIDVPALALFGGEDTNVDSHRNASLLRSLDKPNIEIVVLEGSSHALEDPVGRGNRIFRQDAIDLMVQLIQQIERQH